MRQLALVSRRSSLKVTAVLAASAVVALLAACAQSPVDDDQGGATAETNKAEPEGESARLPPSNPPASQSDAGSDPKPAKDAGSTQPKDASTPPPADSGSGGTGGSCDPNDATYLIKALAEINKSTPRTCGLMGGTCKASECCFDVYGVCVDK